MNSPRLTARLLALALAATPAVALATQPNSEATTRVGVGGSPSTTDSSTTSTTATAATSTTIVDPTTLPVVYVQHPTVTEWLPLTATMPTTVTLGQQFTIAATCLPGSVGEITEITFLTTPDPNPNMNPGYATTITGWTTPTVDDNGTFSSQFTATAAGTFYVQLSCIVEAWISHEIRFDENGAFIRDFSYYPLEAMHTLVVTPAKTSPRGLPPTL